MSTSGSSSSPGSRSDGGVDKLALVAPPEDVALVTQDGERVPLPRAAVHHYSRLTADIVDDDRLGREVPVPFPAAAVRAFKRFTADRTYQPPHALWADAFRVANFLQAPPTWYSNALAAWPAGGPALAPQDVRAWAALLAELPELLDVRRSGATLAMQLPLAEVLRHAAEHGPPEDLRARLLALQRSADEALLRAPGVERALQAAAVALLRDGDASTLLELVERLPQGVVRFECVLAASVPCASAPAAQAVLRCVAHLWPVQEEHAGALIRLALRHADRHVALALRDAQGPPARRVLQECDDVLAQCVRAGSLRDAHRALELGAAAGRREWIEPAYAALVRLGAAACQCPRKRQRQDQGQDQD